MYTAADLIAALRRRERHSLRPRPGRPAAAGWSAWFQPDPGAGGRSPGADPLAPLMTVLLARQPSAPVAATPPATPVAAFRSLWRQRWEPPVHDERPAHALSAAASALLHLVFAILL
ncbi:MAG TPA: transmembrane repetitive protein, partial [Luteimonas sp.]|nr:transmembrane repetitive protein [Luteimonas sp.]